MLGPLCARWFGRAAHGDTRLRFPSSQVAMLAMMPWIIAHAWYGAQIESLTDKVSKQGGKGANRCCRLGP